MRFDRIVNTLAMIFCDAETGQFFFAELSYELTVFFLANSKWNHYAYCFLHVDIQMFKQEKVFFMVHAFGFIDYSRWITAKFHLSPKN